jgi:hypothetical protein
VGEVLQGQGSAFSLSPRQPVIAISWQRLKYRNEADHRTANNNQRLDTSGLASDEAP